MRICLTLLIAVLAWSLGDVPTPAQQQPEKKPRVDAYGDPLPDGAVARLGTVRWRHHDEIGTAVISPDGKRVASAAGELDDGDIVYMWDSSTGKELWRTAFGPKKQRFNKSVSCLQFSPDGTMLVAGLGTSSDGSHLAIFDAQTGESKGDWEEQEHAVLSIKFVENGKTLVSIDESGLIRWWDVATLKKVREWQAIEVLQMPKAGLVRMGALMTAVWSPSGDKVVLRMRKPNSPADIGSDVLMFDTVTRKTQWAIQLDFRSSTAPLAYSADGTMVAIGAIPLEAGKNPPGFGAKRAVVVCDAATGKEKFRVETSSPKLLGFGGQGKVLAIADSRELRIYDTETQKLVKQLKTKISSRAFRDQAFELSKDGKSVLFAISKTTLKILNTDANKTDPGSLGIEDPAEWLRFSADGRTLDTGFRYSESLVSWDLENSKVKAVSQFPTKEDSVIGDVSPDHSLSAVVDGGGVQVRERPSQKVLSTLNFPPQKSGAKQRVSNLTATFSPTNHHIVLAINFEMSWYVFETSTGKCLLKYNEGAPKGIAFGAVHDILPAFSPDDNVMAVSESDGKISLYELASGRLMHRLEVGDPAWVKSRGVMTFSPNGKLLAARGNDGGRTLVWNVGTGNIIRKLPFPKGRIELPDQIRNGGRVALAFSPDGRMLASPHRYDENVIQIWELSTGDLRHELKGHAGSVSALAWSPDGRLLASGSADTTVLLWDVWGNEKR